MPLHNSFNYPLDVMVSESGGVIIGQSMFNNESAKYDPPVKVHAYGQIYRMIPFVGIS